MGSSSYRLGRGRQEHGADSESPTQPLVVNGSCGEKPASAPWAEQYAKSIVYGGLDAIVTSFALVSSISGGNISSGAVLVLGFANLIADGISMGFGDFLSSTTERDMAASRQRVLHSEVRNDLHSQMLDLVSTYKSCGMDEADAFAVVEAFSKYKTVLVNQKLTMQQGLIPPDSSESPWKNGLVTFMSFLLFGSTPLLAYIVLNPFTSNDQLKFGVACAVTALALIILGLAKAKISGQKYFTSVMVVLFNGGLAAVAAYGIGWLLNDVFGIEV